MAEELGGVPRREGGCGIGARLCDARARAGLTVAQAAQKLHVAVEVLDALEAERFDVLGAPIYVKSYLSRYAELLGEPTEALLQRLTSAVVMPEPDLTRIPRAKAEDNSYVTVIVIAVALVVAALLAWWVWSLRYRLAVPMPVSQTTTRRAVPHAAPSAGPHAAPSAGPHAAPSAALSATSSAVSTPRTGAGTSSGVRVYAPTAVSTMRMTLQFPAASWVAITDATGHTLFRGMVPAGATKTLAGQGPLHVVLGYANGVAVTINGHATPISAYVGRDHAVSIKITASGHVSPAPVSVGE